jgi:large subunit ribosomal protein L18
MGRRVQPYRRKYEGKTDYRKRLVLLKSSLPRLVVRKSNKSIQVQLVLYKPDGDHVVATVRATDLAGHGWDASTGNLPAAYLTGVLLATKVKGHGVEDAIVDIGLQTHHKGGRLYAAVKGAIDAGLPVRCSQEALPSMERITGEHIGEQVPALVEKTKKKIMKEDHE